MIKYISANANKFFDLVHLLSQERKLFEELFGVCQSGRTVNNSFIDYATSLLLKKKSLIKSVS